MKIVILDAHTANPGDLSWQPLQDLGECAVYARTSPEELMERAAGAEVLITNKVPLGAEVLAQLPQLRYIGVAATGYNVVDTAAAKARGIVVTNVPGYSTASVAQLVIALLLELTHRVGHHADAVAKGRWAACPDFSFWDFPILELAGRTLGILGYGEIGGQVGRIAQALGMRVLANRRHWRQPPPDGIEAVGQEQLLAQSDVISLHCPLTDETRHLINAQSLRLLKPTAILINTARGPLIDEEALAAALHAGHLAGVGLDVLAVEPPRADHPLFGAPRCLITPHIGWASGDARRRLIHQIAENLRAFAAGAAIHVVNS